MLENPKSYDFTCFERTPQGYFLGRMMYEGPLRHENAQTLFGKGCVYTSPHNGGVHTFKVAAPKEDVEAFLDLLESEYAFKNGCAEFVAFARKQLS